MARWRPYSVQMPVELQAERIDVGEFIAPPRALAMRPNMLRGISYLATPQTVPSNADRVRLAVDSRDDPGVH